MTIDSSLGRSVVISSHRRRSRARKVPGDRIPHSPTGRYLKGLNPRAVSNTGRAL